MEATKKKVIYLSPDVQPVSPEPNVPASVTVENTQTIAGGSTENQDDNVVANNADDADDEEYVQDGGAKKKHEKPVADAPQEASDDDGDSSTSSVNTQEMIAIHPHYLMLEAFLKCDEQTIGQLMKRMVLHMQELTTSVKELKEVVREMKQSRKH